MRYNSHNTCFACDNIQTKCGWIVCCVTFPHLRLSAFICRFIKLLLPLVVSSSINPKNFSFPLMLMKLSQNLQDFHHECEWNEFGFSKVKLCECVCVGAQKGIPRVSTFFNSYRLYVPFVLLIGGSVKWDDGESVGVEGETEKNLIVWWFGKLT